MPTRRITQAARHGRPGPSRSSLGKRRRTSQHPRRKKVNSTTKFKVKSKGRLRYKSKGAKQNNLLQISQHNDLSKRYIGSYWPGIYKRAGIRTFAQCYFHDVNNWVASDAQGKQCVDSLENILTRQMIIGATSAVRNTRQQIAISPRAFCVTAAQATGEFGAAATGTNAYENDKFYVRSVSGSVSMLSLETTPQEVLMYFCVPKKDTNVDPVTYFASTVLKHNMGNGLAAPAAVTTTATAGYGGETYVDIGQNPWKLHEFRSVWRCMKAVKVVLQPGDQHSVSFSFKYNRVFDIQEFNTARTSQWLAGISVVPMVILRGGLVAVVKTAGEPPVLQPTGEVANAKTKVGFVTNFNYTMAAMPANRYTVGGYYPGNVVNDTTEFLREINDVDAIVTSEQI